QFYVTLTPFGDRDKSTVVVKDEVREMMKAYSFANPVVKDVDMIGGGIRPFTLNITGENLEDVRKVANAVYERIQKHPALLDPEISDKEGLPEFQIEIDDVKAQAFGVTPVSVGAELRAQVEGLTPAKFRENGLEYDIRVRLMD